MINKALKFLENVGLSIYIPEQYNYQGLKPKKKFLLSNYIFTYFKEKVNYNLLYSSLYNLNPPKYKAKLVVIPDDQMDGMINYLESVYATSNFSDKKIGDTIEIGYGVLKVVGSIIVLNIKALAKAILSIDGDRSVCAILKYIAEELGDTHYFAFANGGDQNNDTIQKKSLCNKVGIVLINGLGDKIQSSSWFLK